MSRLAGIVLLSIAAAGCGNGSTPVTPSPSLSGFPSTTSTLLMRCEPAGQEVSCTALLLKASAGGGSIDDVTGSAQWSATPSDAVQMVSAGRFRPARGAEVAIDARSSDGLRTLVPERFVVAPGAPARKLGILMVIVRDSVGPLAGATVSVVDGYRAGTTCTTALLGSCTVDPVVTSETFSVRAVKTGYQTGTATFRGSPDGFVPPALLVTLSPQ